MTVKEMHLDVLDQVQHLSANRTRKFDSGQIDWWLTRAQQTLVEAAVTPILGSGRYQIKEEKHRTISSLVVNRRVLTAAWTDDKYVSILPPDFLYLLDDGSKVTQLCKGDTKVTTHGVVSVTRVPFPFSSLTTGYYSSVELLYDNTSIFNINSLLQSRQKSWNGLSSPEAHFYIRDLLIEQLLRIGISVYWENFSTFEYPYHLIFVSNTDSVPISLIVDGQTYEGVTEELSQELHNGVTNPLGITPNTMVSPDKEMSTGVTPYFKTSYISPISVQGPAVIYTRADDSFIVCGTSINYVRKPATISLSLGTDCSLSISIHQQLCNRTVEMMLNRIQDADWKDVSQQNTINSK